MRAKRAAVLVLGLLPDPDGYPAQYERLRRLRAAHGERVVFHLVDTQKSGRAWRKTGAARVATLLSGLLAEARLIWGWWQNRTARRVYLSYPGFVTAWFLTTLVPVRARPEIVLDAFLSPFDTIVNDRELLKPGSIAAGLLFRAERRIYRHATHVVVDTESNAEMLVGKFGIERKKVTAVPLPVDTETFSCSPYNPGKRRCNVLFVGTFVPLHGIRTLVNAISRFAEDDNFHFTLIGHGQAADEMPSTLPGNVTWIRQWQRGTAIAEYIRESDICLGIFGSGEKSRRVWPLKNYLYMAVGRPIITANTRESELISRRTGISPFATVPANDSNALEDAIRRLAANRSERERLASAAHRAFVDVLAPDVAQERLESLLLVPATRVTDPEQHQ